MTASNWRPSGRRKGSHLRGAELTERIEKTRQVFRDKLKHLHGHYHCPGDNGDGRCASPLASLVYGTTRVESSAEDDRSYGARNLSVEYDVPTATLTCARGHVREEVLR